MSTTTIIIVAVVIFVLFLIALYFGHFWIADCLDLLLDFLMLFTIFFNDRD